MFFFLQFGFSFTIPKDVFLILGIIFMAAGLCEMIIALKDIKKKIGKGSE